MAKDELIFESDREAEKARIRSTVTLIACLLAVVAAVVILALIVRGSRTVMETAEGSTPYPVSWGVDKDGQLKLRIDTSATPGGVWEYREPSSILTIEKDKKQPKDGTAFTISASGVGRSDLDDGIYDVLAVVGAAQGLVVGAVEELLHDVGVFLGHLLSYEGPGILE